MGHFIFLILHFIAVMFGFVALFITIPLHLMYASSRKTAKNTTKLMRSTVNTKQDEGERVRCPDCKELILKEAIVCKHCGRKF